METPDIIEFTQGGGGANPLVERFLNQIQNKDLKGFIC